MDLMGYGAVQDTVLIIMPSEMELTRPISGMDGSILQYLRLHLLQEHNWSGENNLKLGDFL